ncbi:MAG: MazG family protein [Clostridia bacterium]|nr:MazG family protein [Clostridia bacterium]
MFEKEIAEFKTRDRFTTDDLCLLIKILRCENGCPWDREQTHKSIIKDFIEETYEVIEAIEADDPAMLCEELGDVLLQVVFHAIIAEEDGAFSYTDAVSGVCRKMVERHPHVFGTVVADTTEKVLDNWDKIKAETKKQETLYDRLKSVPVTFPALMRAQKLIHRSEKFGEAVPSGEYNFDLPDSEKEAAVAEALWQLISAADKAGVDAETVLRHYSEKFIEEHAPKN